MSTSELVRDSGSDRRQAPRIGVNAQVRLHGGEPWSGLYQTADLSTTGAFLVSEAPPPRGTMVRLDLEVDPDRTLRDLQALVVHVRSAASEPSARGCGVMFVRLGKEQVESLRAAVAERLAG